MATQTTSTSEIFADNDVTAQVLNVIKNAKEQIALVSPYIDRVGHVEQELIKAKNRDVRILVVVRRDGDKIGGTNGNTAVAWFKENDIELRAVPSLHAKFYINESEGVITSMNLLRSSWSGSLEIGTSVTGAQHDQLVEYLTGHLKELSTDVESTKPKSTPRKPKTAVKEGQAPYKASRAPKPKKQESGGLGSLIRGILLGPAGYCIRCGEDLSEAEVESGKTMCSKDYTSWARFKNPEFKEKYCVNCGEKKPTTFAKPECKECYYA